MGLEIGRLKANLRHYKIILYTYFIAKTEYNKKIFKKK